MMRRAGGGGGVGRNWERACGLLLGVALDALLGDPRRWHPVAGFGRAAGTLERRMWADSRMRGVVFTALCVGSAVAASAVASAVAERAAGGRTARNGTARNGTARGRIARTGMTVIATWAVLGGRSLTAEGLALHDLLDRGDLAGARERVTHLVGRDPSGLDAAEIARAGVESVAENCSDAVVAPLLWGAVAGVPGLIGYRAVNTLDAMVGHRSPRYERFGWASARLDDVANYLPARVCAGLVALVSGRTQSVWRRTSRYARQHPSPNSGWCEAAYAAALGVRLGGTNVYAGRTEMRPHLGTGRAPTAADLPRAARLTNSVILAAASVAAGAALAFGSAAGRLCGAMCRGGRADRGALQ